jgi:hypothetical protein
LTRADSRCHLRDDGLVLLPNLRRHAVRQKGCEQENKRDRKPEKPAIKADAPR